MHVAVLLYEGFDEMDAVGPFEVFANAASAGADCKVGLYTLDDAERVTASHGLVVEPDGQLPAEESSPGATGATTVDLLVVPGGGWNDRSEAGAWAEAERGVIPEAIADAHTAGATVASVCTGGMLAARAGIFDGRSAVTHASALDDLREYDAVEVVDARVVDDGDVVSAGGVTSGLDLAFHLVEREFGADVAEQVATEMEYRPTDDVAMAE